ncbi:hypothetical protein COCSADRAFT_266402 [Bipolaris sorokiniana ND90Pr]|uniref:Secreted protein n=1 Tax=Cochliobolus sativus (strain ND90Pr / ATCC 201652) TaxID=665912 RepID=M2SNP9_COCSN|nr:uncharacterized protein COCSADRAFT_266402 [Bipolaris sorokiniana ND90Pr]EMD58766.1 hypothetical protein COCSADRAFT_266402 [Bipolaris sorokiniana ND90Pr]
MILVNAGSLAIVFVLLSGASSSASKNVASRSRLGVEIAISRASRSQTHSHNQDRIQSSSICVPLRYPYGIQSLAPYSHTCSTDTSPCSSSLVSRVAWTTVTPDRCQNLEREPKRAAAMALLGDTLGQILLVQPMVQTRRAAKCLLHSPYVHQRMPLLHADPWSALHCHCQGLSLKHVVRRPAHHRLPAAPPLAHF